jgi:hypothetical protein
VTSPDSTGDPRLGDLELGLADAVPAPDAHLVVGQAGHGEIFAERTVARVVAAEVLLPVPIGLDLVDQHCALLAAVPVGVALAVAVDVEPPDHRRAVHRVLPYPGVDSLALPGRIARQARLTDSSTGGRMAVIAAPGGAPARWKARSRASRVGAP